MALLYHTGLQPLSRRVAGVTSPETMPCSSSRISCAGCLSLQGFATAATLRAAPPAASGTANGPTTPMARSEADTANDPATAQGSAPLSRARLADNVPAAAPDTAPAAPNANVVPTAAPVKLGLDNFANVAPRPTPAAASAAHAAAAADASASAAAATTAVAAAAAAAAAATAAGAAARRASTCPAASLTAVCAAARSAGWSQAAGRSLAAIREYAA